MKSRGGCYDDGRCVLNSLGGKAVIVDLIPNLSVLQRLDVTVFAVMECVMGGIVREDEEETRTDIVGEVVGCGRRGRRCGDCPSPLLAAAFRA